MQKNALHVIALVEFLGGIVGVLVGLWSVLQFVQGTGNVSGLLQAAILTGLCSLGIASGWWLWSDDPRGIKWSKLMYGLQIPIIISPLVSYQFICGLKLDTGMLIDGLAKGMFMGINIPSYYIGSVWSAQFLRDDAPFPFVPGVSLFYLSLNINLVALFAYYELVRAGRRAASRGDR